MNIGTRHRILEKKHINEAFYEADKYGSAILAFTNHDFRDIERDINNVRKNIYKIKNNYPNVKLIYSGANNAAKKHLKLKHNKIKFKLNIHSNKLIVEVLDGVIYGPQPFLAIKSKDGVYYHDNFDIVDHRKKWSYTLDNQTIELKYIEKLVLVVLANVEIMM